jgi:hypothetical protein
MLFCCEEAKCKFSKFHRRRRLESDLKFVDVILQQTKNEIFFLKVNLLWRTKKKKESITNPIGYRAEKKKLFFRSLKIVIYFVTQLSFVEREKIDYHFHCLILKTCYFIKKNFILVFQQPLFSKAQISLALFRSKSLISLFQLSSPLLHLVKYKLHKKLLS